MNLRVFYLTRRGISDGYFSSASPKWAYSARSNAIYKGISANQKSQTVA